MLVVGCGDGWAVVVGCGLSINVLLLGDNKHTGQTNARPSQGYHL